MTATAEIDHASENAREWYETIKEQVARLEKPGDRYDEACDEIQEGPLSVMVRDGWRAPGTQVDEGPEEYEILLSTGGPATRIVGRLNEYNEPETAALEVQDWFVPWKEWRGEGWSEDTLLAYARCFYFGD